MDLRRTIPLIVAMTVATAIVGYLSARASLAGIEAEMRREVIAKKVTGRGFSGEKIHPERIAVTAWVEYPFVATGSYSVPYDLHASYHRTRYLVLPLHRIVLNTESFTSM